MFCRHVLILLPVIVAAAELASPMFPLAGHRICLALLAAVFVLAPKKCGLGDWRKVVSAALLSAGGAVATFLLANSFGMGALIASAVVGLLAAMFFEEDLAVSISRNICQHDLLSIVFHPDARDCCGINQGVLWEVLNETWNGVGGRLGTLAAAAVLAVLLTFGGGM